MNIPGTNVCYDWTGTCTKVMDGEKQQSKNYTRTGISVQTAVDLKIPGYSLATVA